MATMIQIRHVPDELHRELKARAAREGKSLSDFLLQELRALAVRPTMQTWLDESATWEPVAVGRAPADVLAGERDRLLTADRGLAAAARADGRLEAL